MRPTDGELNFDACDRFDYCFDTFNPASPQYVNQEKVTKVCVLILMGFLLFYHIVAA